MAQQPNYALMNEQIAIIENTLDSAKVLYNQMTQGDTPITFEDYTELRELYYELADRITNYFDYLHECNIPQKDSYLFQFLYGKYYQIEVIDNINYLLNELDKQAAEEVDTN